MTNDEKENKVDSFTQGFVRKYARKLAGKHGFRRADQDEIEQRLHLRLAKYLHAAAPDDPKWKAFVAITVRRQISSMIRNNRAAKRDHRRVCSIHVVIGADDGGPVELAHTIGEHEIPSRLRSKRIEGELADLTLDVRECRSAITDERHREFCQRLMHDSVSQIARDMGVPRTTLNAWIVKLRSRFEERGLRDYL